MVAKPRKFEIAQQFLSQLPRAGPLNILEIGATQATEGLIREIIGGGDYYKLNIDRFQLGTSADSLVGDGTRMPIADSSFDIVLSFDMIEHLIEPDDMMAEAQRVLKEGGLLVVSTTNLANIYNRMLLLLGYTPLSYSPSRYRVGLPLSPIKVDLGHKSVFTYKAMQHLLSIHNFEIVKAAGFCYYEPFYQGHVRNEVGFFRLRTLLDKMLPNEMREGMIFFSKKKSK